MHTQSNFRLLVVRLGAMGDILHALPAVTALRLAHPSWQIGWVVDPRWQPLLAAAHANESPGLSAARASASPARGPAMPVVDRLHFAAARDWKCHPLSGKTFSEIKALRRELRAAGYTAVLDLQGAIRSAAIARITGCTRRIGEASPREWPAQVFFTERVVTHGAHVIDQDVELASAVAGDALAPADPMLPLDPEAENWRDEWLAATFPGKSQPVALIAPGAGWGAKRWPPERYAQVARGLAARGMRVLVNAGPGEETLAAPIVATGAAVPLSVTLPRLIALTRRIALCIGGDTGPLHLACALGRPVVGIYGPTDPSRNGPYGTHAAVLRSPTSRRDHTRRETPDPGLLTIAPDDVLRAADKLLAEEKFG
ncbi:MAG: glycosyltransferase family 9 protein [Terracidiphilus sp.]